MEISDSPYRFPSSQQFWLHHEVGASLASLSAKYSIIMFL